MVCRLNKTLYGLKQAPYAWNQKFSNLVLRHGSSQSSEDKCFYVKRTNDGLVYLLLYVDDIILASNCPELLQEVKELLMSSFSMKFLGELHSFLGIEIDRSSEGLYLNQS